MTRSRKIALAAGSCLAALIVGLFALPILFSGPIEDRLRAEIGEATSLDVTWQSARLGLLGDFPHPSLRLEGLTVAGTGDFVTDTLLTTERLAISLHGPALLSAVRGRGPLTVRTVRLEQPNVRLRVTEEGRTNWGGEVYPTPDEATTDPGPGMALSLRDLRVEGGRLDFDDRESNTRIVVDNIEHELSGDFSRASLDATTSTRTEGLTVVLAGAPYLSDVDVAHDGSVSVDMNAKTARLADQRLQLNALELRVDGSVASEPGATIFDLAFEAPGSDFGEVLSLLSTVYDNDFESLETTGRFALNGEVRGRHAVEEVPAFSLDLTVEDGRFQYPDLPLPADSISARLSVSNPGGSLDATVVDLSTLRFRIGQDIVDASAVVRTPVSDPEVDFEAAGRLDLAALAQTIKLPDADELTGQVEVNASVRARRSDLVAEAYERVDAEGTVAARDVTLRSPALRQPVDVHALDLSLSPASASLTNLDLQAGSSDIRATGRLDNLLAYALGSETLVGEASFESDRLVLDEWRSEDEVSAIKVPGAIDLTLDGVVDQVELNGIQMTNARGRAVAHDEQLDFEGIGLEAFGGQITVDGTYETTDPTRPTFALALGLDSLDVGQTAAALTSFRTLVPIAEYARGTFSTDLDLQGALGANLSPDFDVLEGDGSFATSPVEIQGFPIFERLSERLQLDRLSNPTVDAIRSGIQIEEGRLLLYPFDATVAGMGVAVTGSNGIDQSIDYELTLAVPRAGIASSALDALASAAGPLGARLANIDPIPVRVSVTGFVLDPSFAVSLGTPNESLQESAVRAGADAAVDAVQPQIDDARARADSTRAEALRVAQARADSIVAEAERAAETIRTEGAAAASEIRNQADRAANELIERASNPIQRVAAERAAAGIREEADERATAIEQEANTRADQLVEEARERADRILATAGGG